VTDPTDVYTDLRTEGEVLDHLVAGLDAAQWDLPTPAPGWTIKHQVAHLSSTARIAGIAATDAELFAKVTVGADKDFDAAVNAILMPYLDLSPADLLARWRSEREDATKALSAHPPGELLPWVARQIPAGALACAGFMELFAHGQDIHDAIGAPREYSDRIGHLVWFGTRNRDFGYLVRGLTPPEAEFRYEITGPSGKVWEFGPADAENRITGPAVDFCLLVTRRRHHSDLAIVATGAEAEKWLDLAMAYRGSPGPGRQPGQFSRA